ncbi:MAG: EF-hand domain-containing protein [Caulobacterales bacterium]|nr:EF-hand domain-containing protein [Caulobacterales bacterium]
MTSIATGGSSLLQQLQQAMFAKADVNADGQLSSDEFLSIGQNMPPPGKSGPAHAMRGGGGGGENFTAATMGALLSLQEDRSSEIFSNADSDGDGLLTADELATDMAAHGPPGRSGDATSMASDLVSRADADGDGVLSLDEFKSAAPPPPPGRGGRTEVANDEAASPSDPLDTDGDGKVSMAELLASLQATDEVQSGFSTEASDLLAKLIEQLTADSASTTTSLAA